MTEDQLVAIMLWRAAMARMAALNTELTQQSHRQSASCMRDEMRAIAESRLSGYFAHVERMLARNPIPDTPGDCRRQAA
jgi:hypothetical protein